MISFTQFVDLVRYQARFQLGERRFNLLEYVGSHEFFFASNKEQEQDAAEACQDGILQPMANFASSAEERRYSKYFWVRRSISSRNELPDVAFRIFNNFSSRNIPIERI